MPELEADRPSAGRGPSTWGGDTVESPHASPLLTSRPRSVEAPGVPAAVSAWFDFLFFKLLFLTLKENPFQRVNVHLPNGNIKPGVSAQDKAGFTLRPSGASALSSEQVGATPSLGWRIPGPRNTAGQGSPREGPQRPLVHVRVTRAGPFRGAPCCGACGTRRATSPLLTAASDGHGARPHVFRPSTAVAVAFGTR